MMKFPIYGKYKMFQTTNQLSTDSIDWESTAIPRPSMLLQLAETNGPGVSFWFLRLGGCFPPSGYLRIYGLDGP